MPLDKILIKIFWLFALAIGFVSRNNNDDTIAEKVLEGDIDLVTQDAIDAFGSRIGIGKFCI